jgi:hypothetical protein
MSLLTENDLVFSETGNGVINGGGFNVTSILKNSNIPILNNIFHGGAHDANEEMYKIFQHLSIPRGIMSINVIYPDAKNVNDEVIPEDIHSKLLKMVEYNDSHEPYTKKHDKTKSKRRTGKKTKKVRFNI